jgi:hypothetical protein
LDFYNSPVRVDNNYKICIHVLGFKGLWTWEEGKFQGKLFLFSKGGVFGALCKPNASGPTDSVLRGNVQRNFGKLKLYICA